MQNNNAQPPISICHKVFSYIMNGLIARGIRRLTTTYGGDLKADSSPKEYLDGEIMVQFRHSDGLELHKVDTQIFILENEKLAKQGILSRTQKAENLLLHIKDGDKGRETSGKQPKDIVLEATNIKPVKPLKIIRPFSSVSNLNINEKSDEFIRRKREAMRRNYSLDQP